VSPTEDRFGYGRAMHFGYYLIVGTIALLVAQLVWGIVQLVGMYA
jgi:hypothetical protein